MARRLLDPAAPPADQVPRSRPRRYRTLQVAAAAVVIMAAGTVFVGEVAKARVEVAKRLDRQSLRAASGGYAYFECLEASLAAAVPKGARLYVDHPDQDAGFFHLSEVATPRYHLVDRRALADVVVRVGPKPGPGTCGGFGITYARP